MPSSKLLLGERPRFICFRLVRQDRGAAGDDDLMIEADAPEAAAAPFERLGIRVHRAEPW
jgi:hypothetical protein